MRSRRIFAALAEGRLRDAAAFTDPVAAEEFKAAAVANAAAEEQRTIRRIDTFQDAPRYRTRYGVANVEELRALTMRRGGGE